MKLLRDNEIHLWIWQTSDNLQGIPHNLSPAEVNRANEIQYLSAKNRFLKSRYFLRKILSHYLGTPSQSLDFVYSERGKPRLEFPDSSLEFNLSHSGDWMALAIALTPLGLDIEELKDRANLLDLAEKYFSPKNRDTLKALTGQEQLKYFLKNWTFSEAYLKAQAQSAFHLKDAQNTLSDITLSETELLAKNWWVHSLNLSPRLLSAVCTKISRPRFQNFLFSADDLEL